MTLKLPPVLAREIERWPEHELSSVDVDNQLWPAMVFLAALAYPESHEKRDRAILAMKALVARAYKDLGGTEDVSSMVNALRVENQRGTLNLLQKRLDKRLYVGHVVSSLVGSVRRPGLRERVSPVDQKRTRDYLMRRGASMEAAVRMTMTVQTRPGSRKTLSDYARQSGTSKAKFMNEWWAPEVFHLALSFFVVSCRWKDPRGFNIARLLANPGWSLEALRRAEFFAGLTRASNLPPSLHGIRSAALIRLIPTA